MFTYWKTGLIGKEGSKVTMHTCIKEESKAVKTRTSRKSQILNLIAQKIRSLFKTSRGFIKHQIIYIYTCMLRAFSKSTATLKACQSHSDLYSC